MVVEKEYAYRCDNAIPNKIILRTENALHCISKEVKQSIKIKGISKVYIQKHTPKDNGNNELFHISLKTEYI